MGRPRRRRELCRQAAACIRLRNWGYAKLIDLVTAIGLFEVKREGAGA
jgi:hypothetical protein